MNKNEIIGKCKICGKNITWDDLSQGVEDKDKVHELNGIFACRSHHGVDEWYNEEMKKIFVEE